MLTPVRDRFRIIPSTGLLIQHVELRFCHGPIACGFHRHVQIIRIVFRCHRTDNNKFILN